MNNNKINLCISYNQSYAMCYDNLLKLNKISCHFEDTNILCYQDQTSFWKFVLICSVIIYIIITLFICCCWDYCKLKYNKMKHNKLKYKQI